MAQPGLSLCIFGHFLKGVRSHQVAGNYCPIEGLCTPSVFLTLMSDENERKKNEKERRKMQKEVEKEKGKERGRQRGRYSEQKDKKEPVVESRKKKSAPMIRFKEEKEEDDEDGLGQFPTTFFQLSVVFVF